jgi:RNA polymerase sigma-70 factor (ECF subfamily)
MSDDPSDNSTTSTGIDLTSSRLLQRLKTKDSASWQQLSDLYGPLLYHWCRHAGLQAQDAADVMQEVFVSVWGAIAGFQHERGQGRFRKWLWTIARNKIHDHFRRQAGMPGAQGGTGPQRRLTAIPEHPPEESSTEQAPHSELKSLFGRALEMLRSGFELQTWDAFWQVTVEGRPTAEVARALNLSPASVRQAKCRVLRRIREELGDLV